MLFSIQKPPLSKGGFLIEGSVIEAKAAVTARQAPDLQQHLPLVEQSGTVGRQGRLCHD